MPHVSVSKLSPGDESGTAAVAAYYTQTIEARTVEMTMEDFGRVIGYYGAGHGHDDSSAAHWYGGSVERLGLEAGSAVAAKQMRRVLQQLDPTDGGKLENNGGRRATLAALDLTISAEKDLSALWMLGGEEQRAALEEIMNEATREGLAWMEERAAVVRRGKDGLAHRSSSGFLAVEVDHTTARPVDGKAAPHLHRHVVIMNIAEHEGTWTALDATRLFDLQKATGAIIGQRVRELTEERLGLSWERDDAGIFRVDGFDASLRNRLSLRQQQILEKALAEGYDVTNRSEWVAAQRISREGKNACGADHDAVAWAIEELERDGVTLETVMTDIEAAQAQKARALEDRTYIEATFGPCPADRLEARDWLADVARGWEKDGQPDWDRARAAMAIDTRSRQEIIHDAMLSVGREKSTWREKDLIVALCDAGISLPEAQSEITTFLSGPDAQYLFGIADDPTQSSRIRLADNALYATTETLEKEKRLLEATIAGIGTVPPLLSAEQLTGLLGEMAADGRTISPDSDQYDMISSIALGGNRITLIGGQAGAGKSAGLEFLGRAQVHLSDEKSVDDEEPGVRRHKVVGCALAAAAAENLELESGIKSYSISMLTNRLDTGAITLEDGAIVVVDECSQASTAQLASLWDHIKRANGRLVLAGDPRQLQAVEAGGLYVSMMDQAPDATLFLDETRRQNNLEERAVLAALHDRGTLRAQSLSALERQGVDEELVDQLNTRTRKQGLRAVKDWYDKNGRIVVHKSVEEASEAMAVAYWDAVEAGPEGANPALVMAKTNHETRLLDRALVAEAIKRQHLDPEALVEFGNRSFLLGQRVVARKVDRRLGVLNGTVGVIEGTEEVTSRWGVELSSPGPYSIKRVVPQEAVQGDELMIELTPRQVASQKAGATKYLAQRRELVAKAEAQFAAAGTSVTQDRARANLEKRKVELARAKEWRTWAKGIPSEGGAVWMTVESCVPKDTEERLIVRTDEGEKRHLTAEYTRRHLDSGYAVTTQRAQGQTVQVGLEYGQLSYVGMSRGRQANFAHIVVPDTGAALVEEQRAKSEPFEKWVGEKKEGSDRPIEDLLAQVRQSKLSVHAEISDALRVQATPTTDEMRRSLARSVVDARSRGVDVVAIAKTREMAGDLSDSIVSVLVEEANGRLVPATINGRTWVVGQPVIVARGEVDGLDHGSTTTIASVSESGMFLELDNGKKLQLSPEEVEQHLDSGLAVTAARARRGIEGGADGMVVVAEGLDEDDLRWIEKQARQTVFLVTDPVTAANAAYEASVDDHIMELLDRETRNDFQARSIHSVLEQEIPETGLESLQAEIRLTAKRIDEVRTLSPREVAIRDLEHERIQARKRREELEAIAGDKSMEYFEDNFDASRGMTAIDSKLEELGERYAMVTGKLPDDDEDIAHEIEISQEYHSADTDRLAQAERRLARYTQARVTSAIRSPQPYHQEIKVGPELDVAAQQAERLAQLIMIEEYRTKWGITDELTALGEVPRGGLQAEEWAAIAERLGRDAEYELHPDLAW